MILVSRFFHPFSFGWENLSSTQDSVWPLFQTPVSSSKYSTKLQLRSDEGLMLETSGFESLSGQFTLSRKLVNSNCLVYTSHRGSSTVSLENYPLYSTTRRLFYYPRNVVKPGFSGLIHFINVYASHHRTELSLNLELYHERLFSVLEISENVISFVSIVLEVC